MFASRGGRHQQQQQHGSSIDSLARSSQPSLIHVNQPQTQAGHVGVARLLLSRGAPVEACDGNGSSTLLLACLEGQLEVRGFDGSVGSPG